MHTESLDNLSAQEKLLCISTFFFMFLKLSLSLGENVGHNLYFIT